MLASNKIAWGMVWVCAAVAAGAVHAKTMPANPFRQPEVRASKTAPVAVKNAVVKNLSVGSNQGNDNPFRREEAKPAAVVTRVAQQPATESKKQEPQKQEPTGPNEVFLPFASETLACEPCATEPLASEEVTLANPLAVKLSPAVKTDRPKLALVQAAAEEVARPSGEPFQKPIGLLGVNISLPKGTLPKNEAQEIVSTLPLFGDLPRPWPSLVYHWEAAATWHQPLYFEQVNAERYGYQCNWVAQPFVSTAHFFGTLPALPYLMTVNCPRECVYTLGNYRPGSCPPWRRHCIPCYEFGLW